MKKLLSILLLLALLFALVLPLASCKKDDDGNDDSDDSTPPTNTQPMDAWGTVLRFAVTSDLHLRATDYDYESYQMLQELYNTAYGYSEAQDYNQLDAIIFAGDFTENGKEEEMTKFFNFVRDNTKLGTTVRAVLGNHEFYATRYDDGTTSDNRYSDTSVRNTYANFLRISGYSSVDAHMVVNGYHFIVLNNDRYALDYDGSKFSPKKLAWLETELQNAAAQDPTGKKPIFLFQHEPGTGTVNNAGQYAGDDYLEAILNKYPQVVDFSGHTHYPITDPQSIWQDGYTAINTASLAYLCTYIAGHPQYNDTVISGTNKDAYVVPTDWEGSWNASGSNGVMRNAGLYYIVEVNNQNQIRIVMYNIYTKSVQQVVELGGVGDPSKFTFTDARKDAAEAPVFPAGATITPQVIGRTSAVLRIPQATCETGVNNYRVELYLDGMLMNTTYRLSCDFLGSAMPATVAAPLNKLYTQTTYEVKVYPVNHWGMVGEPLVYEFTTLPFTAAAVADVLATTFNTDGSATNTVTGKELVTQGTPTITYDTVLERNVAVLNGKSGYAMHEIYQHYDRLQDGFTIEAYINVSARPSHVVGVLANMESGGFGFEIETNGKIRLPVRIGSSYTIAETDLPLGQWVHVVGVYTGTKIQLYINGVLKDEKAAAKNTFTLPANGAHYLSIGGDSTPGAANGTNFMTGKIAVANVYSEALSMTEILALYQSY